MAELKKESFVIKGKDNVRMESISRPSLSFWQDAWRRLKKNKAAMFGLTLIILYGLLSILAPMFSQYTQSQMDASARSQMMSSAHWLGTDSTGRDLWVRIWMGGRVSLSIGLIAAVVNYTYKAGNIRGNDGKMKEAYEILFSQTESELADISWSEYDDVLFISKSIGTIIAASYAKKHGLESARHVLYTPLAQTYHFAPNCAIGFIGTQDPWSDTDEIIRLSDINHIPLTVYEGCNHSLECDDTLKNIENLKDIMLRTLDFCDSTRRSPQK